MTARVQLPIAKKGRKSKQEQAEYDAALVEFREDRAMIAEQNTLTAMDPTRNVASGPASPNTRDVSLAALAAAEAGWSVVLPSEDGSKRPAGNWKHWQTHRRTPTEVAAIYQSDRHRGLGAAMGAISGNLECFEFDRRSAFEAYRLLAHKSDLGDLLDRVVAGYSETTPNGVHLYWRCSEIAGNLKLATGRDATGKKKTLIETRGEGGFVILAPSHGPVHPSGRPYSVMAGTFGGVAEITSEERQELLALARVFDEVGQRTAADAVTATAAHPKGNGETRIRPGDVFNERHTWPELLNSYGWTFVYSREGTEYWRRPGKSRGVSATTGWGGKDFFYSFSSSTELEMNRAYDKFGFWVVMEHGGDFKAAAKTAAEMYGMEARAPEPQASPVCTSPVLEGGGLAGLIAGLPTPAARKEAERIRSALAAVGSDAKLPDSRLSAAAIVGRALAERYKASHEMLGKALAEEWSALAGDAGSYWYSAAQADYAERTGREPIKVESIFKLARIAGWRPAADGEIPQEQAPPEILRCEPLGWDEIMAARLSPDCIVENYLFCDVALLCGAGGLGKTTILIYEAIHIALGRELWGLRVKKPGKTLIVTAEDSREIYAARIREVMYDMDLSDDEMRRVIEKIVVLDVSGEMRRLAEKGNSGNIIITTFTDSIIESYKDQGFVQVIFDPTVSFGPGEREINDGEQAIITACRRIKRAMNCLVRLNHHTGKANARDNAIDQYAGRGGSALPDGCRMVAILAPVGGKDGLSSPPDMELGQGERAVALVRAKLSYAPPDQPYIWIRRHGWVFDHHISSRPTEEERQQRAAEALARDADALEQFLIDQLAQGRRYTLTEFNEAWSATGLKSRAKLRAALAELKVSGRVFNAPLPSDEQHGGRKTYLHPRRQAQAETASNPAGSVSAGLEADTRTNGQKTTLPSTTLPYRKKDTGRIEPVSFSSDPITLPAHERQGSGSVGRVAESRGDLAVRALSAALVESGHVADDGVLVVSIEAWRQMAFRMGIAETDEAKARTFRRAHDRLLTSGDIQVMDGLCQLSDPGAQNAARLLWNEKHPNGGNADSGNAGKQPVFTPLGENPSIAGDAENSGEGAASIPVDAMTSPSSGEAATLGPDMADMDEDAMAALLGIDTLSRVCPACGAAIEYPDCERCGYLFDQGGQAGGESSQGEVARLVHAASLPLRTLK